MKAGDFGPVGDIILGIGGAFLAGWLLPQIGILIGGEIIGSIINALIGAHQARLVPGGADVTARVAWVCRRPAFPTTIRSIA
jgi:hypothetical protein